MFKALDFVFDGVSNDAYGIYILDFDGSAKKTGSTGSTRKLVQQKVPGRPVPYLLGYENSDVLEFQLTFGSLEPLSRDMVSAIQRWLFGAGGYKSLQIIQEDMYDYHYECILRDSKLVSVANYPYAFTCTITCNAPWAWTNEKVFRYSAPETINVVFMNKSDNTEYDRPVLEITASVPVFSIINHSDGDREFKFEGLQVGEKLIVDNDRCIIESSSGLNRLNNFNYNFFRLAPGVNRLTISGGDVQIKYKLARKVGA